MLSMIFVSNVGRPRNLNCDTIRLVRSTSQNRTKGSLMPQYIFVKSSVELMKNHRKSCRRSKSKRYLKLRISLPANQEKQRGKNISIAKTFNSNGCPHETEWKSLKLAESLVWLLKQFRQTFLYIVFQQFQSEFFCCSSNAMIKRDENQQDKENHDKYLQAMAESFLMWFYRNR